MTKRNDERVARILGVAGFMLAIFLLSSIGGCASLWPLGGAMAGGAAGRLGGPGGAALGAGAGYGAGVVLESTTGSEAAAIAAKVEGMTPEDIRTLITATAGESKGFMEKLEGEIYALIKIVMIVTAAAFAAHFAYSWRRRQKGESYYADIERLKSKLK